MNSHPDHRSADPTLLAPAPSTLNYQLSTFPAPAPSTLNYQLSTFPAPAPSTLNYQLSTFLAPAPSTLNYQLSTFFQLLDRLDSLSPPNPPTVLAVFRLYCVRQMTVAQVARSCRCSVGTVSNRLKLIRAVTGLDPAKPTEGYGSLRKVRKVTRVPETKFDSGASSGGPPSRRRPFFHLPRIPVGLRPAKSCLTVTFPEKRV